MVTDNFGPLRFLILCTVSLLGTANFIGVPDSRFLNFYSGRFDGQSSRIFRTDPNNGPLYAQNARSLGISAVCDYLCLHHFDDEDIRVAYDLYRHMHNIALVQAFFL